MEVVVFQWPKGGVRDEALAFLVAAIERRHVGRGPGLIDEY
jgi:hypothetical protein